MSTTIHSDQAPAAIGPYSQAKAVGSLVFCSGQIALRADGSDLTDSDVSVQTRIAMENLQAVLAAAGTSLENAIKVTIYLIDMVDFQAVNSVYAEFFSDAPPARATVAVAGLPRGARVEIDCIAAL
jgi:2-iminobutanoate/2-iminopropanoate deaminase